jgi:hypothetical protein
MLGNGQPKYDLLYAPKLPYLIYANLLIEKGNRSTFL